MHLRRQVAHGAKQMFDLVADVERYSEFVPHCQRHRIVSRRASGNCEVLITDMTISRGIFRETIRSRDTLDRSNGRILVQATGTSLRRLETEWTFEPRTVQSCDVGFNLVYEFANPVFELLFASMLESTFRSFMRAFERRADLVYARTGPKSSSASDPSPHGNNRLEMRCSLHV